MGGDHAKMVAMMELYIKYSLHGGRTTELVWRSQEMLYRKDGTWVEIGRNRILPDEPVWWTENISKEIEGRSLGREAERVWMYSCTPWWLSGTGAWSGRMMLGWMRLCGGGKMNQILEAPYILVSRPFYLMSTYCSCKVHNQLSLCAASTLTVSEAACFLPSSSQVLLLLKGSQAFFTNLALEDLRGFFLSLS